MSVLPVLMNANICTSNLYMFNYGHERAWTFLNVLGLIVFLCVAYLLSPHLPDPVIGIALAVIAKECTILVVSLGFFLTFGVPVMHTSQTHGAAHAPAIARRTSLSTIGDVT
jgi:hypothetical protein